MSQQTDSFEDLGLGEPLLRAVRELGLEHPTAVQADMIPPALAARDILAEVHPGTGRTAAYGLPLLQHVPGEAMGEALVLVPNRDRAVQVGDDIRDLGRFTDIRVATLYGGQRVRIQAERLNKNPSVIVSTPGRLMEMHTRGLVPFENVRYVVLDELDHMLDLGFRDDIRRLLGTVSHERQTIFISGVITPEIEQLASQYLRDPLRFTGPPGVVDEPAPAEVRQCYFTVDAWDKSRLLVHLLEREEPALTLIFCHGPTVEALTEYLQRKGVEASTVHGEDEPQEPPRRQGRDRRERRDSRDTRRPGESRDRGPQRGGLAQILVTSDHGAVGLEVPGIVRVINFDLPDEPEIYIHRVGRAAAAGASAEAWSFVTPDEENRVATIERVAGVHIERGVDGDFTPAPPPAEAIEAKPQLPRNKTERPADLGGRGKRAPPSPNEAADRAKFPAGLVPAALPARRMGGRVRTGRK